MNNCHPIFVSSEIVYRHTGHSVCNRLGAAMYVFIGLHYFLVVFIEVNYVYFIKGKTIFMANTRLIVTVINTFVFLENRYCHSGCDDVMLIKLALFLAKDMVLCWVLDN
jgi:hypothetical protein